MSERVKRLSRRNFLLSLGAGGAATAAAVATRNVPQQKRSGNPERAGAGYQESAHVRNYYRTAKV
jgi:hypothetical protein